MDTLSIPFNLYFVCMVIMIDKKIQIFLVMCITLFTFVQTLVAQSWNSSLYPEGWSPPVSENFYNDAFLQDWSYAGYRYGEEAITELQGEIFDVTLSPYSADNTGKTDATDAIQQAINDAQNSGGGVVYLPAGTYNINPEENPNTSTAALIINKNNVVLKGAGKDSTFLINIKYLDMRDKHVIRVEGSVSWEKESSTKVLITADLMSPTKVIPVTNTSSFSINDIVLVRNYISGGDDWVYEHNVEHWYTGTPRLQGLMYCRKIIAIDSFSETVTLDIPIRYALKQRDGSSVHRLEGMVTEIGLRDFSIGNVEHPGNGGWEENDYNTVGKSSYDVHKSYLVKFQRVHDSYIKNVSTFKPNENTTDVHILSNGILLDECKNVTIADTYIGHSQYGGGGGNGYAYRIQANETLIENSKAETVRHGFVFAYMKAAGNVFYNIEDFNTGVQLASHNNKLYGHGSDHHMVFSHSNLIDGALVYNSNFVAGYRPYPDAAMTKHALTSAHSVYWNTKSVSGSTRFDYLIWSQQGRYGYVIGTSGSVIKVNTHQYATSRPDNTHITDPIDIVEGEGMGDDLFPRSLYLSQLSRRLNEKTSTEDKNLPIPFQFVLNQNYPNPFKKITTIDYIVTNPEKVSLVVYNTLGQEIKTLQDDFQNAGKYSILWDRKNNEGHHVASGLYFIKLKIRNHFKVKKMMIIS